MESKPSITIIGTGAVGSALLHFFEENDFIVKSFWNSKSGSVYQQNSKNLKAKDYSLPKADFEIGDLIFITTPDDTIAEIANNLADSEIKWNEKSVVHCSGNLTSSELDQLKKKGAKIASMHPIQTFKRGDGKQRLDHIFISLEGDESLCAELERIIKKMGSKPLTLTKNQKRTLHIAAVFSSNYVVALMHKVETLLKNEGLSEGLEILEPLIHQTFANIFEKGTVDSLTGPIARGDYLSVEKHIKALEEIESVFDLYKILGREALEITKKRETVSDFQIEKLRKLLEE